MEKHPKPHRIAPAESGESLIGIILDAFAAE